MLTSSLAKPLNTIKKLSLEVKKPKSWCKSVSAFANTLGGILIWGVSNDGQIVGLESPDSDAEKNK